MLYDSFPFPPDIPASNRGLPRRAQGEPKTPRASGSTTAAIPAPPATRRSTRSTGPTSSASKSPGRTTPKMRWNALPRPSNARRSSSTASCTSPRHAPGAGARRRDRQTAMDFRSVQRRQPPGRAGRESGRHILGESRQPERPPHLRAPPRPAPLPQCRHRQADPRIRQPKACSISRRTWIRTGRSLPFNHSSPPVVYKDMVITGGGGGDGAGSAGPGPHPRL